MKTHILITGAGGGLGTALAKAYASPNIKLSLLGRNTERLSQVKLLCSQQGAESECIFCDLNDIENSIETIKKIDAKTPIDLAFINAGISSGVLPNGEMEAVSDVYRLMHLNSTSSITLGSTILKEMNTRQKGQVVFISSLSAYFPLASSPAYSASKAAILSYALAMNSFYKKTPIRISVACPGYIKTPMSLRLKGFKPFYWTADKAAFYIKKQLEKNNDHISFPFLLSLGIKSLNFMPNFLSNFFADFFKFSVEPDAESIMNKTKK
ncbi:SDR family NAD(P)-dependent oxidoreductase [Desulfovibrio litoralis]|uniref:Short-chain dehydrogenase n=1 Tax=Desulfovibrio litoralis DSM 11393 TaxID=1121455 RepID=A0A1M7TMW1_9BACT|nr:SDR family NAD(P)-dependent oxidoreductase [Desulfovibrio litoralis]SHN72074.1 Short-chain dehydrogenase [Desulfovibrio litoralis DSM 11393]